jgi:pleiotropic regulator 1
MDTTVRIWDIVAGKCVDTLTNHKKSIRSMIIHPREYTFCTAASDNIKVWKCPEGKFLRNISGHHQIVNTVAMNSDNVLVSGADDGSLKFFDWSSGYNFQSLTSKPQPGSIAAENGIFCSLFDKSSMRYFLKI